MPRYQALGFNPGADCREYLAELRDFVEQVDWDAVSDEYPADCLTDGIRSELLIRRNGEDGSYTETRKRTCGSPTWPLPDELVAFLAEVEQLRYRACYALPPGDAPMP